MHPICTPKTQNAPQPKAVMHPRNRILLKLGSIPITDTVMDTNVSVTVSFFIPIFTLKQGIFLTLQHICCSCFHYVVVLRYVRSV